VLPQKIGDAIGALAQLGEREPAFSIFVCDPECGLIVALRNDVEIVECPVEGIGIRPAKAGVSRIIVFAMAKKKIACLQKPIRGVHSASNLEIYTFRAC